MMEDSQQPQQLHFLHKFCRATRTFLLIGLCRKKQDLKEFLRLKCNLPLNYLSETSRFIELLLSSTKIYKKKLS